MSRLSSVRNSARSIRRSHKFVAIFSVMAFAGLILDSAGNAAETYSVRVNAGGWADYTDTGGKKWAKDTGFVGGTAAYLDAEVTNTKDQELFRTERYGMSSWSTKVPNGSYTVNLGFSENAPWAAERIFSVKAENTPVLNDINIRQEVGNFTAMTKTFDVVVSDGELNLGFSQSANFAKISTIEVLGTTVAANTPALPNAPIQLTATIEENSIGSGVNQVQYKGDWFECGGCAQSTANNNYRFSLASGNTATVNFTGTQAKFYSVKEYWGGMASISIDGGTPAVVDTYALSKSTGALVFTTPVLRDGNHVMVITMTGNKQASAWAPNVSFDKVDVYSGGLGTTPTTVQPTTTTAKPTTTTAAPTTTTMRPTTTTVKPTTTTAAPTTTTTKPPATTTTTTAPSGQTVSNTGRAPISPYWGTPSQWDNFDGTRINNKEWYVYDAPSNAQSRTPSQVQVNNGMLNLVGVYDSKTKLHTSGGTSWNLGRAKYGKWEIRMRSDAGAGFSPTALLWPDTEVWPRDGEIDIFEAGPWPDRKMAIAGVHNGVPKVARHQGYSADFTQWHTFGVEWAPTKLTFFLDGKVIHTETDKRYIPSGSSMHIALQNDTGCGWTVCPNSTTKPITNMQIDYVSMWKMSYSQ